MRQSTLQILSPFAIILRSTAFHVVLFPDESGIIAESEIKCTGRTGAEMEALTAVSVALLTVYDMCKAVDKIMVIDRISSFGKKQKMNLPGKFKVLIITLSDRAFKRGIPGSERSPDQGEAE